VKKRERGDIAYRVQWCCEVSIETTLFVSRNGVIWRCNTL